jgi:hypothetical protein
LRFSKRERERTKTYLMAPMSSFNSPNFSSVFTSIVYGINSVYISLRSSCSYINRSVLLMSWKTFFVVVVVLAYFRRHADPSAAPEDVLVENVGNGLVVSWTVRTFPSSRVACECMRAHSNKIRSRNRVLDDTVRMTSEVPTATLPVSILFVPITMHMYTV